VFMALVWLGQLPVITVRSSACPFPSSESALICSDGVISRAFDHLELSPRPLCSLPFISKGEEPCTTEREPTSPLSLSLSYILSFVSAFCLLIAHHNTCSKSVAKFAASFCQSKGTIMQALLPAGADQLFLPCSVQEIYVHFKMMV